MNNILPECLSANNNIWGKQPEWDKRQTIKNYSIPAIGCLSISLDGQLVYCMGLLFGI